MSPETLTAIQGRTLNRQDRWNILLAQQDIRDLLAYVEELQAHVEALIGVSADADGKMMAEGVDQSPNESRVGT